jgi:hypothetical protein
MARVIRIRDVVRGGVYELGPHEPILRGPYELFNPVGPALRRGALIDWLQDGVIRSARVAPAVLGDVQPGERVLLHLAPYASEDEWWLCDVDAVDGVAAAV